MESDCPNNFTGHIYRFIFTSWDIPATVLCGSHVPGQTQGTNQESDPDRAFTPLSEMILACPTPAPLVLHQSHFTRQT